MNWRVNWKFFILGLISLPLFYLFYLKYVPLVPEYQSVLLPILFLIFILTLIKEKWGLLFFIFLFPLINNLPYFFRLYPDIPHAPTALILFLVFFISSIWHRALQLGPLSKPSLAKRSPILSVLSVFALLIIISGLITLFRFTNFFPFYSNSIYEWRTNINGVSAGGAIMSTVFNSLNYLTGLAFFYILSQILWTNALKKLILTALIGSTSVVLAFGFIQLHLANTLGNTPFWVNLGQINSTLKDPNSAAAFLSSIIPLFVALTLRANLKCLFFLIFLSSASLYILSAAGSRSSFGGLIISLFFLALLVFRKKLALDKQRKRLLAGLILGAAIMVSLLLFLPSNPLASRLRWSFQVASHRISQDQFFNRRLYLWKAAIEMVKDYPLTGVGIGAYIIELPNYLQKLGLPYNETDSALNYILQIAAELGMIGVVIIFFIAAQLGRWLISRMKSLSFDDPDSGLILGATCGLTSLAFNFLFHTYVGSYEIKYLFWLLLTLAFLPTKQDVANPFEGKREISGLAHPLGKKFLRPSIKLISFLGLSIYTSLLLWHSTHSLSLGFRSVHLSLCQEFGLDRVEKTADGLEFRWSGKHAALPLHIKGPVMILPLHASHPDIQQKPVTVELSLYSFQLKLHRYLGKVVLNNSGWVKSRFDLEQEVGTKKILLLKVSRTWNPYKAIKAQDLRNLGVAIGHPVFSSK